MRVFHLITLVVVLVAVLSMVEGRRRKKSRLRGILSDESDRGGRFDRRRRGRFHGFDRPDRRARRERRRQRKEERKQARLRAALLDEDRERASKREGLGFSDKDLAEKKSSSGVRAAINDDLSVREKNQEEKFLDFDDQTIHKEAGHTALSYENEHREDKGSKTSFSSGHKSHSAFEVEQDKDEQLEQFDRHEDAVHKETKLETEKEEQGAREKVLKAEEEDDDFFSFRFFDDK